MARCVMYEIRYITDLAGLDMRLFQNLEQLEEWFGRQLELDPSTVIVQITKIEPEPTTKRGS